MLRRNAEAFHDPGKFVTFNAFELSGIPDGGGDVIIYCKSPSVNYDRMIPTTRGVYVPVGNMDKVAELIESRNRRNLIIIPHNHAGDYSAWRKGFDNESVRLLEIYSVWGNSEVSKLPYRPYYWNHKPRTAQEALALGYKVGFLASGDDHSGKLGSGSWLRVRRGHQSGLVGAYAASLTREALWDALWNRRVYGTTGARIVLEFSVAGHPMGSVVQGGGETPRRIRATVIGTNRLKEVDIIKNNRLLHRQSPEGPDVAFDFTDGAPASARDWYYLRVVQQDTEMAWSSPVWLLQ